MKAAALVKGPLWASGALLLPVLPAAPLLPVLSPILGENAVAVCRLGLGPSAFHRISGV